MTGISVIVKDEFYANPFDVRACALLSSFNVKGNYPGMRTRPFLNDGIFQAIQELVQRRIVHWPQDSYNGAFQFTTETDKTWIHADYTTNWAGVIFLTPDAPSDAGTAFFRHIPTGYYECPADLSRHDVFDKDATNYSNWECTDRIGNIFNRLILFNGNRFHASAKSFGDKKENSRLFQTFFFSTL